MIFLRTLTKNTGNHTEFNLSQTRYLQKRMLTNLLKELMKIEGIKRIRLYYAFPADVPGVMNQKFVIIRTFLCNISILRF